MKTPAEYIGLFLDALVTDQPHENLRLWSAIQGDPIINERFWAKTVAWNATGPYESLDLSEEAGELRFPTRPDLFAEVANEMTRAEKLALRKRILR